MLRSSDPRLVKTKYGNLESKETIVVFKKGIVVLVKVDAEAGSS